ncbi:Asp-tRNA(Asn)/Glu-tRNA(Gln) amidotransferase subunit GatC [Candidatus Peregrinibacteria bacterium]|nr:MAG: Asp-tRNA(Asn)/Glu-tRNA(Gln) amidotransferase subunit GatC [Candidatus Peregrinibacteria bacterium]
MIVDSVLVEKLAHLARIKLSQEEVAKFATQLSDIFSFFEKLQEVDTNEIEPMAQVTGLTNAFRDDIPEASGLEKELLSCSPLEISRHQISAPKTFS